VDAELASEGSAIHTAVITKATATDPTDARFMDYPLRREERQADGDRSWPIVTPKTRGARGRVADRSCRWEQITGALVQLGDARLKEAKMPILLWLVGVPLSIVVLLMLFGVIQF
jgi:hypothetical protein